MAFESILFPGWSMHVLGLFLNSQPHRQLFNNAVLFYSKSVFMQTRMIAQTGDGVLNIFKLLALN